MSTTTTLDAAALAEVGRRFHTQLIDYLDTIWVVVEDDDDVVRHFPMEKGLEGRLLGSLNIPALDALRGYLEAMKTFVDASVEALDEFDAEEVEEISDQLDKFQSSLSKLSIAVGMERNQRPGNIRSYTE